MLRHQKNSLLGGLGWFIASAFYGYQAAIKAMVVTLSDQMMADYSIGLSQFAMVTTAYAIGYAAMQIPVGIGLDHFSLKKMMTSAIGTFAVCCFCLSLTNHYLVILMLRFIMGISAAASVLGAFKVCAEWFDSNMFATLSGLTVTLGFLTGVLGNKPVLYLSSIYSIQEIFFGLGIFGILLAFAAFVFIKNFEPIKAKPLRTKQLLNDISEISCNKKSLVLIFYAMLVYTPMLILNETYGAIFFKTYFGYDANNTADILSAILITSAIAAPLLGWISDRSGKRRPIIVLAPIIVLVCLLMILFRVDLLAGDYSILITALLCIVFSAMTWGFLLSYSVFKETHSSHVVSTGLGMMNSINMLGGIIIVPIIGQLMEALPNLYPSLTSQDIYFYAFLSLPLIILSTLPLLRHIPETNCRSLYD